MALDPRRRALEQMALGGAVPSTEEVDVAAAPVMPAEFPTIDLDGGNTPVPQAIATGAPQGASERDYYADALNEKHARQFSESLGGIGSGILQAFTGVGPSEDSLRRRREYEEEPLVTYVRRQQEADKARTLDIQQARALRPSGGGALKAPVDVNSPEVKRLQAFARARWPDEPEEVISAITPVTLKEIRTTLDAKYGIESREGIAADAGGRDVAKTKQQDSHFWAKMAQDAEQFGVSDETRRYIAEQGLKAAEAARDEAAAERAGERVRESTVPGFEPTGKVLPTKVDAEKLKESNEAAARMQGNINDLRALHRKYGETPKGAGAELQQQKLRAIQIEAKNIAGLGALSGPDFSLMQDLSAQDVNSIGAWVRRNFVGATLEQSLRGLEQWMRTSISATAKARGYAPQRKPAASVLPPDASGQPTLDAPADKVRVIINGKPRLFPRDQLEAVKKRAVERGDTLEVPNG